MRRRGARMYLVVSQAHIRRHILWHGKDVAQDVDFELVEVLVDGRLEERLELVHAVFYLCARVGVVRGAGAVVGVLAGIEAERGGGGAVEALLNGFDGAVDYLVDGVDDVVEDGLWGGKVVIS